MLRRDGDDIIHHFMAIDLVRSCLLKREGNRKNMGLYLMHWTTRNNLYNNRCHSFNKGGFTKIMPIT